MTENINLLVEIFTAEFLWNPVKKGTQCQGGLKRVQKHWRKWIQMEEIRILGKFRVNSSREEIMWIKVKLTLIRATDFKASAVQWKLKSGNGQAMRTAERGDPLRGSSQCFRFAEHEYESSARRLLFRKNKFHFISSLPSSQFLSHANVS